MAYHRGNSSSWSMAPPPRPSDTSSLSTMRERAKALDEIKHRNDSTSKMVELIHKQLEDIDEEGWAIMSGKTDKKGIIWTRRLTQELLDVQKDSSKLSALNVTVAEFRAILLRHSSPFSIKYFKKLVERMSESSLPEVECLKFSLSRLRPVDVEAIREKHDRDGTTLSTLDQYLNKLNANLQLADERAEERGADNREEATRLNELIHWKVKEISDLVWKMLGPVWPILWNKTVQSRRLPLALLPDPRDELGKLPTLHSLGQSHRAFIPVTRQSRFRLL